MLAWWFDWLPHHGLEDTQSENRYRATRNRVGLEWLFTPLMLSQNYHLVHHLHPSIPFYRYLKTWRRNEEAYLERDAAISTAFGKSLNPEEFREWKQLNRKLLKVLPVRMPTGSSAPHAVFHRLPVASVDPITADSTLVTFAVPEELREQFRFEPGQHVTVKTDLGGEGVRRNYSICAPATRAMLRIAVKHIPGGAFSTFVAEQLKAGDVLEVMTPTGRFCTAARSAQPQALRRDRRRQRDHPDPLDPPDHARARDRQPVHADLRQPHQATRRCSAPSSTSSSPATPTGSRSCTSSRATRSTPPSCAAGSTATSSNGGWRTSSHPRPSTSGSCAARSSSRRSFARR